MKKIFLLGAMVCALGMSVSAQSVPIKQNHLTDRDAENQGKPQLYGTQLHEQNGITAHYPTADIHNVESQDESIAIYYTAPYRLEKSGNAKVNALLRQLYHNHKHTVVTRKVFLRECKALKGWLEGK